MTRDCQFEYGSFETDNPLGWSGYTYTGMHIDGVPWGVGMYEKDNWIYYATIDENKFHGFRIYHYKSDGYLKQYQEERRQNDLDGFNTDYYSE